MIFLNLLIQSELDHAMLLSMDIYIYIYIYAFKHGYIYIYIYIQSNIED